MAQPNTFIEARESVALAGPGDARVIVGEEALKAAGYDPTVYHAVIPSEGMRGGKLNKNGRIYGPPSDVASHHMALVQRAREAYVGGEQGHPLDSDNPTCPSDAIKILDGDVVAQEDGSNLTRCLVGLMKTTTGTDAYVMWKAGKPTGLSLRGIVTAQEHTLTKESPYAAMNPGRVGETVELRRLRALETYDVVFDPSFGTFFAPPEGVTATESVVTAGDAPELQAAAARLRAAGVVIESTSGAQRAQEHTMEIKDIKGLESAYPELVKQLRDEVAAKVATEATASVNAQAAANQERIVALEAANKEKEERLRANESALATVRAELARKEIVGGIVKALEAWADGKPGAVEVVKEIVGQAEGGAYQSAEEATNAAGSLLAFVQRVSAAQGATVTPSVATRAGITGERPAQESTGTPTPPARPKTALELLGRA